MGRVKFTVRGRTLPASPAVDTSSSDEVGPETLGVTIDHIDSADDAEIARIVALASEPFPDGEDEPLTAAGHPVKESSVDAVTVAALAAIQAAHTRTVQGIQQFASGRHLQDGTFAVLASAVDALGAAARRDQPTPHVEVTVQSPDIQISTPEMRPTFTIDVQAAQAPNVEVHVAQAHIEVTTPEQKPPDVFVNVEQPAITIPAPIVRVAAAAAPVVQVTVEQPRPRTIRVGEDENGNRIFTTEEVTA